MKTYLKWIMLIACVGLLSVTLAAQDVNKQIKPGTQLIQRGDLVLKLNADLRVDYIHSSNCPNANCELVGVDALYLPNIMVDISNGKGSAAESDVEVSYFDLMQGRMVTVIKPAARMNPYPTNPWTMQRFVVVNNPVLIKKSVGVRARITPKGGVTELDPSNNEKTIKQCSVMVY